MDVTRKQITSNCPKKKHFLPHDTQTHVCVSGGKKYSFSGKFDGLCSLVTPVLDLPFCVITNELAISEVVISLWHLTNCQNLIICQMPFCNKRVLFCITAPDHFYERWIVCSKFMLAPTALNNHMLFLTVSLPSSNWWYITNYSFANFCMNSKYIA